MKKRPGQNKPFEPWTFLQSYYVIKSALRHSEALETKDTLFSKVLNLVKKEKAIEDLTKEYYSRSNSELEEVRQAFRSEKAFLTWLMKEIKLSKHSQEEGEKE